WQPLLGAAGQQHHPQQEQQQHHPQQEQQQHHPQQEQQQHHPQQQQRQHHPQQQQRQQPGTTHEAPGHAHAAAGREPCMAPGVMRTMMAPGAAPPPPPPPASAATLSGGGLPLAPLGSIMGLPAANMGPANPMFAPPPPPPQQQQQPQQQQPQIGLGWAEPVRQLYSMMDAVQQHEASSSGRLMSVRVQWGNRPGALAQHATEVVTVPQDCSLGYLRRCICKATGGALWPRELRPVGHSASSLSKDVTDGEEARGGGDDAGIGQSGGDAGAGGLFRVTHGSAISALPHGLSSSNDDLSERQTQQQQHHHQQQQGLEGTQTKGAGEADGGAASAGEGASPRSASPPRHGGGNGDGGGGGASANASASAATDNENLTLSELGILSDSLIVMEADVQLLPFQHQLLTAVLQTPLPLLASTLPAAPSTAVLSSAPPPTTAPTGFPYPTLVGNTAGTAAVGGWVGAYGRNGGGGVVDEPDGDDDAAGGSGGGFRTTSRRDRRNGGGGGSGLDPGSGRGKGSGGGPQKERFTLGEMTALVSGIEEFGLRWALIQKSRPELQNKRQGDLKDK
ncbi:hypothetical protein Agub_g14564, partial [Astrephomene gubernaculifera]